MPHKKLPKSEWPHFVAGDSVPPRGRHLSLTATAEECAAIAERLDVDKLVNLQAEVDVTPQNAGHVLYIHGRFAADIVQSCVVSGKPVESHLAEDFEAWYADHDKAIPFRHVKHDVELLTESEEVQILDEHEDPEPMLDGQVDVGDVVIQYLSLAVNPYPRHPDHPVELDEEIAVPTEKIQASGAGNLRPNPFAALKNWRPKD